ncbi:MAG: AzlD domain-containing protein [Caldilineaceae bacterium]|nr:AzlD domain-containing protein [Caldilineaceae bacterium]
MTLEGAALIAGMAMVTFLVRYPPLALVGRIELPEHILRAMKFVPPAVLAAIIAPALIFPSGGSAQFSLTNAALVAGLTAALVSWRSRNLLLTIVVGMTTLWLWRWLVQG